jgi:hypothetical protein
MNLGYAGRKSPMRPLRATQNTGIDLRGACWVNMRLGYFRSATSEKTVVTSEKIAATTAATTPTFIQRAS